MSQNLFNSFVKLGHEPTVLAYGPPGSFADNDRVLRLGDSPVSFLLQSFRSARNLDLEKYDIIFIQHSAGAGLVSYLKRVAHPNVIAIIHVSTFREMGAIRSSVDEYGRIIGQPSMDEYAIKYISSPVLILLENYVYRSVNRLIGICRETTKLAIQDYGISPVKIKTITNGVDLETFHYRSDGEKKFKIKNKGKKTLLFVGVLRRSRKGAYHLIEAFRHLRHNRDDIDLVVAGDGGHHPSIKEKIKNYDLEHAVKFYGKVNHADLPYLYSQVDALIVPSIYEGLPLVILEALACGTPVAATNVSGHQEVINRDNGILLGPYDPKRWIHSILELIDKHLDRDSVGETVAHLNWDRIAAEYIEWAYQ